MILYFIGLTESYEGEGYDRKNLKIPQNQEDVYKRQHLKDAMELTAEMLVRSNYTDTKRLYEILTELKSRLQSLSLIHI